MNLTRFKARILSVSPSTNNIAKRQATTIINPATSRASYSPTPDSNAANDLEAISAGSPASQSSATRTHSVSTTDRRSRTIALMNVPDTVTSDRIRVLAENYGALVKIQLRPDHQGATLEYVDAASAGRASLGLEGYQLEPNRKLRVGTTTEMFQEKAEFKSNRIGGLKKKENPSALQNSMPIRRPTQPSARRGGRGGLGVKKGGVGLSGGRATNHGVRDDAAAIDTEAIQDEGEMEATTKAKSNADFKAMFLKQ